VSAVVFVPCESCGHEGDLHTRKGACIAYRCRCAGFRAVLREPQDERNEESLRMSGAEPDQEPALPTGGVARGARPIARPSRAELGVGVHRAQLAGGVVVRPRPQPMVREPHHERRDDRYSGEARDEAGHTPFCVREPALSGAGPGAVFASQADAGCQPAAISPGNGGDRGPAAAWFRSYMENWTVALLLVLGPPALWVIFSPVELWTVDLWPR